MKLSDWLRNVFFSIATSAVGLGSLAASGQAQNTPRRNGANGDKDAIRPFHINVPDRPLTDLRRRNAATQWHGRENVSDATQGVRLATIQKRAQYGATDYDWRKCEAKLNALPQFVPTFDGLDIHFIHVHSKNANTLPVIITHGFPAALTFPDKIYTAPRTWTEKAYPKLIHYNQIPKGGHFAAWEQPELFSEEIPASFRSLR